ncbi:cold-shock protein, partial [Mycolicibacterium insubricum]|nr:cold-shock protein [Mycolicibacterium insubricum]
YVPSSALPAGVTDLKAGQRVEFGIASGRRGPQALQVTLLGDPAEPGQNPSGGSPPWRVQIQPAQRRPGRHRRHLGDRQARQRDSARRPARGETDPAGP